VGEGKGGCQFFFLKKKEKLLDEALNSGSFLDERDICLE